MPFSGTTYTILEADMFDLACKAADLKMSMERAKVPPEKQHEKLKELAAKWQAENTSFWTDPEM